jgi:hypothetical protein
MKKTLYALTLLFAMTWLASDVNAQEVRQANLTETGIVQLNANDEPNGRFEIQLDGFQFESPAAMTAYFQERCDENVLLRAVPGENKVLMIVKGDNKPNWTVADWNNYLAEKLSEQPILPQE